MFIIYSNGHYNSKDAKSGGDFIINRRVDKPQYCGFA